ncbi:hypothetical protein BPAE_0151g00030 [Botrytis paeoniae]|uniref:Uncharacterized protein n=1 Tax=Botrytis paeoniae TaxID=278948 RepID=A0A4Z1FEJ2_9HELO|nr:hypothetical protein BPAE_0151g00030 [Botrytis paeoniae]
MFSRLRFKLSRVLSPDKEEGTVHEKINDVEKKIQSHRYSETKKNTHPSPKKRNRSVNSLERECCLLNLPKHDPRNDNLPLYSSTQTSRPSSGLPGQQKPSIKGKEIKNDKPPPYNLPENTSSASRCQYIRGLIDKRKAEIRTLEQQLEEEVGGAVPSFTNATLRIGESSPLHITLQREATQEEKKEGVPRTDSSSQTKGTTQDIEYYIQLCNKTRDIMIRDMKLLQDFQN